MPSPLKELYQIGTSTQCASACERKYLTLTCEQARLLHEAILVQIPDAEFYILSTCNRAEFYLFARPSMEAFNLLRKLIGERCPEFARLWAQGKIDTRQGIEAYEHLLRVVCGIESLVLGDTQIVQQARQSLTMARDAGATGLYLERAIGGALRLGSRVRTESDISVGSAGVAAAVCDTISAWRSANLATSADVLLLGAGAISSGVGRLLSACGGSALTVMNRSLDRAEQLAEICSARTACWEHLIEEVSKAQIIVAATAAPLPIIDAPILREMNEQTEGRHRKLIIDPGMPPNVETLPLEAIDIIGIDHLRERQDQNLHRRQAAIPYIHRQIAAELEAWQGWLAQQPLEDVLKSLYLKVDQLPGRLVKRVAESNEQSGDQLHSLIYREIKQLLHPHVYDMRRVIRNQNQYLDQSSCKTESVPS